MRIQWYPGHMAKTRRLIEASLKQVDIVCEIIDARIPVSSRNGELESLIGDKPRLLVLNRADQADPVITGEWRMSFENGGVPVIETDCKSGAGMASFPGAVKKVLREKWERYAQKGQSGRVMRAMIVGVPNVGKSAFINRAAKRKAAETRDKPGVTRGKQWISVDAGLELLDTPGILAPKFEDETAGRNLAFTGAVKDEIITDIEALAAELMEVLMSLYPKAVEARYKLNAPGLNGFAALELAAKARGFLISGGEPDTERMANTLLDEFRGGVLGRISIERPPLSGGAAHGA